MREFHKEVIIFPATCPKVYPEKIFHAPDLEKDPNLMAHRSHVLTKGQPPDPKKGGDPFLIIPFEGWKSTVTKRRISSYRYYDRIWTKTKVG